MSVKDRKIKPKRLKNKVEKSLIKQLEDKGANVECFVDLISDYMDFWTIKEDLLEDIKNRGVVYKDLSSVGVEMDKNNPSTKEVVNISRQMLAILKQLDLSTEVVSESVEDEL